MTLVGRSDVGGSDRESECGAKEPGGSLTGTSPLLLLQVPVADLEEEEELVDRVTGICPESKDCLCRNIPGPSSKLSTSNCTLFWSSEFSAETSGPSFALLSVLEVILLLVDRAGDGVVMILVALRYDDKIL